ncbi:MAG: hypothetical protein D6677_05755 [Calditrichaeota bacterium]|nr:MAG: hypothetical protein D6677_05755 [Calditrichota bacterium]
MRIRKYLRIWHRDLGYFFAGITIIFALSGLAVNHIDDWNPNYKITHYDGPLPARFQDMPPLILVKELGLADSIKGFVKTGPASVRIFFGMNVLDVDREAGVYRLEKVEERSWLRAFNRLHLNELKNNWVWFSDLFAVVLLFLSLSGLVMVRGKKGFAKRGVWLLALGMVIPIMFLSGIMS